MGDLVGGTVGRYEVERLLSTYVTDSVYVARDPALDRSVLLKTQNEVDGHAIGEALVRNEARVLAQLSHPGIQRIYDTGRHTDGRYYFVAEHLAAGRLKDVLRSGATGADALVQSIAAVADALGYAHRRGFVHRNVKPGTIWFDAEGQPRLVGFSLSVRASEAATADLLSFVGHGDYASPEEIEGRAEEVGPRSDVWAMGAVLHEVLTGKPPRSPARGDGESRPPVSPALRAVVDRCLAPAPADRYGDGDALAAALRAAASSAPTTQAPRVFVSHSSRDREWVEREVVGFLERNGIRTWYAKADIVSADQWERTIVQGLESSDWFLLVMSPQSTQSEWVRDEVFWAVAKRPGRILPVLLAPCNPWDLHIRVARIQHLDFSTDPGEGQRLLLARLRGEPPPAATQEPGTPRPPEA